MLFWRCCLRQNDTHIQVMDDVKVPADNWCFAKSSWELISSATAKIKKAIKLEKFKKMQGFREPMVTVATAELDIAKREDYKEQRGQWTCVTGLSRQQLITAGNASTAIATKPKRWCRSKQARTPPAVAVLQKNIAEVASEYGDAIENNDVWSNSTAEPESVKSTEASTMETEKKKYTRSSVRQSPCTRTMHYKSTADAPARNATDRQTKRPV